MCFNLFESNECKVIRCLLELSSALVFALWSFHWHVDGGVDSLPTVKREKTACNICIWWVVLFWEFTSVVLGFSREHCTRLLREEHEKIIKQVNDAAAQQELTQEGPDGVIDLIDDDLTIALSDAYFPSERREAQLLANQRKMSELSKHNEEYQERLQALSDIFEKATVQDTPAEVGLFPFKQTSQVWAFQWRSTEMSSHGFQWIVVGLILDLEEYSMSGHI